MNGPVVHKSIVFGHLGWLLGYQCSFDTAKSALTRNNCAVGYQANDFTLHTNVNDGTDVGGSIYQKVNSQLGYFSKKGVKLIVSGLVDGKNINGGGHKLGLGLELAA